MRRNDAQAIAAFEDALDARARRALARLDTPARIQAFLDSIPYSPDACYRCPRHVLRDRQAHCFDGALFAAAALRRLGHRPLVLDMFAERDDDHMLALYRRDGHWGAIAKSNFSGMGFREAIHRNLRELALSYFEDFFNVAREKSLRGYCGPLDLRSLDRLDWMTRDENLEAVAERLDALRRVRLFTPRMIAQFAPVDRRAHRAGLLGADPAGLFRPPPRRSATQS